MSAKATKKKGAPKISADDDWLTEQLGQLGDDDPDLAKALGGGGKKKATPGMKKKQPKLAGSMSKKKRAPLQEEPNAQAKAAEAEAAAAAEAAIRQQAEEAARKKAAAEAERAAAHAAATAASGGGAEASDDDDDGYGEEDFEDYDDDGFEDDEDSDDEEDMNDSTGGLVKAMRKENAAAAVTQQKKHVPQVTAPVIQYLPTRSVVLVEEKVATRTKVDKQALSRSRQRWKDLIGSGLVKLSSDNYVELLDRKPCSMFEIQCLFGTTNRRHCRAQTGEDNVSMETQTEQPATKSTSMQSPDDLGLAVARSVASQIISEQEQKATGPLMHCPEPGWSNCFQSHCTDTTRARQPRARPPSYWWSTTVAAWTSSSPARSP